jgi:hypothetical protein
MHLVNMPKVRVKKYPKGWVVERQVKTWYGKKYWIHIESVSGIESQPWYYQDLETAITETVKHFDWDLRIGTRDFSLNAL